MVISRHIVAALSCVAVCTAALLLPALAAALPPEYPAAWAISPGGMRTLGALTTDAGFCKGPSGYVFEVASQSSAGGVQALISKVATGSGAVADSWTYPATPDTQTFLPKAIARDAAGNVVVAMEDRTAGGWMVAKFSAAGTLLWDEPYPAGADRQPWAVCVDRSGAVIVAGQCSVGTDTGIDGAVVKWPSSGGDFKWAKTLSGAGAVNDSFLAVGTDAGKNVYVCGSLGGTLSKAVLQSYSPAGAKRWFAPAPRMARNTQYTALVVKGSSVYAAGDCRGTDGGYIAAKYTVAGKRLWGGVRSLIFPASKAEGAHAGGLAVDSTNAVVVAGEAGEVAPKGVDVPSLWKLTPLGKTAWHRELTGTGWSNGGFTSVALDSKDRIYAAGMSGAPQPEVGMLIMRYSASGTAQAKWTPGAAPGMGEFLHVLVVSSTQVLASGIFEQGQRTAVVYRAKTTR